jgi:hypothetical protein
MENNQGGSGSGPGGQNPSGNQAFRGTRVQVNQRTKNPFIMITGILQNVGSKVLYNVNNTPYRIATIKVTDKRGNTKAISGFMFETNYKLGIERGMAVGDPLLTRVENTGRANPIVTVSHLIAGERVDVNAFNWETGEFNFASGIQSVQTYAGGLAEQIAPEVAVDELVEIEDVEAVGDLQRQPQADQNPGGQMRKGPQNRT